MANATNHGCFLDVFFALPAFNDIKDSESERNAYIEDAAKHLSQCIKTQPGLDRPYVREWQDNGGDHA